MAEPTPDQVGQVVAFLRNLYRQLDRHMERLPVEAARRGLKIACRGEGCNWCCYDVAMVTSIEAVGVTAAVNALPREVRNQIADQFRAWFEVHKAAGTLMGVSTKEDMHPDAKGIVDDKIAAQRKASFRHRMPCPLLVEGRCSVYEDRPVACRGHFAAGESPDACNDADYMLATDHSAVLVVMQAIWGVQGNPDCAPLPEMLREVCGETLFEVEP